MEKIKDLEYFMNLNYNLVIKRKENYYYVSIPELLLFEKGETFDEVYEKLEKEKENFFEKAIEMDEQDIIKEPRSLNTREKRSSDLFQFLTKLSLISCIIGILIYIFINIIIGKISTEANEFISQNINIKRLIIRHGDKYSTYTEVEKEKTRLRLRKYIQQIKPLIDEIMLLWEDENKKEHVDKEAEKVKNQLKQ